MDNEFIVYSETKELFESQVSSNQIDQTQIGVIAETGELWVRGNYYPLTKLKTINGQPVYGDGDINVAGGSNAEPTHEEFTFRASAGADNSISDESAIIKRIKGNTIVWNQHVGNPAFSASGGNWSAVGGSLKYSTSSARFSHSSSSGQYIYQTLSNPFPAGHKILVVVDSKRSSTTPAALIVALIYSNGTSARGVVPNIASADRRVDSVIITPNADVVSLRIHPFAEIRSVYTDMYSVNAFDLTRMFGAGNEPESYSEFKTLFNRSYYLFSRPNLQGVKVHGIETVGANAFNKDNLVSGIISNTGGITTYDTYSVAKIEVIPGEVYQLTNVANAALVTRTCAFYNHIDSFISDAKLTDSVTRPTAISGRVTVPNNANYMRVVVYNEHIDSCCVNIKHDNMLDVTNAKYFKYQLEIPEILTYFPDGMHRIGDVFDEITNEVAIQRLYTRDYIEGDEENGDVMTDGSVSVQILQEPVITPLTRPIQLTYKVADYGTEKMFNSLNYTPFSADIVYQLNAIDRINDNVLNISRLEKLVSEREPIFFIPDVTLDDIYNTQVQINGSELWTATNRGQLIGIRGGLNRSGDYVIAISAMKDDFLYLTFWDCLNGNLIEMEAPFDEDSDTSVYVYELSPYFLRSLTKCIAGEDDMLVIKSGQFKDDSGKIYALPTSADGNEDDELITKNTVGGYIPTEVASATQIVNYTSTTGAQILYPNIMYEYQSGGLGPNATFKMPSIASTTGSYDNVWMLRLPAIANSSSITYPYTIKWKDGIAPSFNDGVTLEIYLKKANTGEVLGEYKIYK